MKKVLFFILLSMFITEGAFAFTIIASEGKELKWKKVPKFLINEKGCDDFENGLDGLGPAVSEFDAIQTSFANWVNVGEAAAITSFDGVTDIDESKYDKKNVISWVEEGWKDLSFNPPAGALAVTITTFDYGKGEIIDADILFNGDYFQWANVDTESESFNIDIENIATHEIGHFFGLDHSSDNPFEVNDRYADATMYYAAVPGDISGRSIEDDDLFAIIHLYPKDDDQVPEPGIYSISVETGKNTEKIYIDEISGANFNDYTFFRLVHEKKKGDDIIGETLEIIDSGHASCTFDLYGAYPGKYNVVVTNLAGQEVKLDKAFTITGVSGGFSTNKSYEVYGGGGCGFIQGGGISLSIAVLLAMFLTIMIWVRKSIFIPIKVRSRIKNFVSKKK